MIKPKYASPFKTFCVSIGVLPSDYTDSLSYLEMLEWFCNYLENEVIPAVNNNGAGLQELQNLYTELKSYVDNYFDNLDVQQEINNKLDDMAESGTLEEIIAEYLSLAGMITYNNVSEMKLSENLINGSKCQTLGFHSINDGGGATYKIRTITNDDIVDEATIISLYDDTLIAELILDQKGLNAKQFGAYGDNTHDDTSAIQLCIDTAYKTKIKVVNLPKGIYLISEPLEVYENKNYDMDFNYSNSRVNGYPVSKLILNGSNDYNTMLKATAGDYIINCYATTPVALQDLEFNNLYFNGNSIAKTSVQMNIIHFGGRHITFNNCVFNLFTQYGVEHWLFDSTYSQAPLKNNLKLVLNNCNIQNNKNGLKVGGDDTYITNCKIQGNEEYGILIDGAIHNFNLLNCKIQYNGATKTLYAGGQIKVMAKGASVNISNCYMENKSGTYSNNDTGIIIFDRDPNMSEAHKITIFNIENNYINVGWGSCVGERINQAYVDGLSIKNNFITELRADTVYLFKTSNEYLSGQGFSQGVNTYGNYVNAKTSDGSTTLNYWYISNDDSYSTNGSTRTEFGMWGTASTTNLKNQMPTIVAGSLLANGNLAMRKIGDFTVTKTDVGKYTITLTHPITDTAYDNENYPVIVSLKNQSPFDFIRVTEKTGTSFKVETGTWNSDFTTLSLENKPYDFVVFYVTKT